MAYLTSQKTITEIPRTIKEALANVDAAKF